MAEYIKTFEGAEWKVEKFYSLRRVEDRVEVVREAVMSHQEYRYTAFTQPTLDSNNTYRNITSCFPPESLRPRQGSQRSKELREQGNKLYQARRFPEAVKMYTEAAVVGGGGRRHCVCNDEHP